MWAEIYDADEARKIDPMVLKEKKEETFEIRLIVWETRDVPLVDGDDVDIFVKVIFDPTGRPEEEIEKKTDVH
jgi:hypothetical protein